MWAVGYVDYKSLPEVLTPTEFLTDKLAHVWFESGKTNMPIHPVQLHGSLQEYPGEEFQVSAKKVRIESMNLINGDTMSDIPGMENVPGMPPGKPLVDNNVTGRLFLVNHRMFFAISMAEPRDFDAKETQRFLDSFQISSDFFIK